MPAVCNDLGFELSGDILKAQCPIPTDQLYFWVGLEPFQNFWRIPRIQHIQHMVTVQINQDAAVTNPFAFGPVVYPYMPC
ncbi:hypothetical protein GCM10008938_36980 [Deinococcus roseus]|uniref:Uncharacterized protein n=1 Tax=Deinococcus roseus TaxID=392414 RepID=A0ABQ2D7P9_9DEIO|nr:hypothetical protein GCM10008938_36980 [Deinococcus roseus]